MKKITILTILLLVFGINALAQDKEHLIKVSQSLEEKPFSDTAKDNRAWAVRYIIETNDVSVKLCGGKVMEAILDKKNKYGSELTSQYTIAMAAFKLANPTNKNENDAQYAGLVSATKAYENMLKEKPKAKHAGMDELVTKRENGDLRKMVDEANCGKEDK